MNNCSKLLEAVEFVVAHLPLYLCLVVLNWAGNLFFVVAKFALHFALAQIKTIFSMSNYTWVCINLYRETSQFDPWKKEDRLQPIGPGWTSPLVTGLFQSSESAPFLGTETVEVPSRST